MHKLFVALILLLHIGIRNQEEIGSSSLDIYTGTWPGHWYEYAKDSYLLGHEAVARLVDLCVSEEYSAFIKAGYNEMQYIKQ